MKLVTSAEMRSIEEAAVRQGVSLDTLMQCAGNALADVVMEAIHDGKVLILVGPGNNGGDGLVAAERLRREGRDVAVYAFHRSDLMGFEGPIHAAESDEDLAQLRRLLPDASLVVDALLGIGQNRPVEGLLAGIVNTCNDVASGAVLLAADIPTGISADSGAVLGTAFRATTTICMGLAKVGAVVLPGAEYAGKVRVVDVGLPAGLDESIHVAMSEGADIARMLPQRPVDSNKGTYGRVLIVGGSADFLGAPALSALAALRVGAGLLQVASIDDVVQSVSSHALEPIYARLPAAEGKIARSALEVLSPLVEQASAVVLGPGLGSSDDTLALVRGLLDTLSAPKSPHAVVDADGLNALSRTEEWWRDSRELVLTPHPGEMSRLTEISIGEIQQNRIDVARRFAARWNAVVVLKGARTVVANPSGHVSINGTGGPNLATGGTGDVLSGMIGGLLAQGLSPFDAAVTGAYLHGLAGDTLEERYGDAGTLAGDLPAEIPRARLRVLREAGATAT